MSEAKMQARDHKTERRLAKKQAKKNDKKERKQQMRLSHRVEHYTLLKTTAIIFFVAALLFLISFFLTKFCNYYFNFGDDRKNYTVSWLEPFEKWNWEIRNDFRYVEATVQSNVSGVVVKGSVLVIENLFWAGTSQAIAVTREALVLNNFANILLYIFFTVCLVIGIILLLCYFLVGRRKIREVIGEYTDYKVALATNNKENSSKAMLFKETIIVNNSSEKVVEAKSNAIEIEIESDDEETVLEPTSKTSRKKRKKYPNIGKKDIVTAIYQELNTALTMRELNHIYDLTFITIVDQLEKSQDNEIMIPNFGKFVKVKIPSREGINPSTGKKVWIPEKYKVKFTPAIGLKRLMEEKPKKKK